MTLWLHLLSAGKSSFIFTLSPDMLENILLSGFLAWFYPSDEDRCGL
jgi:hypothetical protein